jgi:hypothetical protein
MRYVGITLKSLVIAYASYLLLFLAVEYHPDDPLGFQAPFFLWVLDTVNLFIHEAGHLFCSWFGQTIYILGGSLVQVLLPLLLAFVTWREKPHQVGYPLFWTGESLVNVSVYIADAPHKNLKLIKEGLIHDWNWLLRNNLDIAETIGSAVRGLGLVICAGALVSLIWFAWQAFRND